MRRLVDLQERRTRGMLVDMRPIAGEHASNAGIRAHQWEPGTTPKGHPYLEDSDYCGREFKVKLPPLDIPQFARDALQQDGIDDQVNFATEDALNDFRDEVKSKYKWIGKVNLAGRGSGWLVIEDESCGYKPSPNDETLDPKREDEWEEIQQMVTDAMSGLIAYLEGETSWKDVVGAGKDESRRLGEAEPATAEDDEPVVVLFRKWPESEGGDVIALFPGLMGTREPGSVESYQHIGQHGNADFNHVMRATKAALPSEYEDLQKELESAPYHYKLIPRSRAGQQDLWWTREESGSLGERSAARTLQTNRPAIVDAMAKYAYASAWADAYEEKGGSLSGVEIMDIAPPPTPEAKAWAEKVATQIERLNDASLDDLIRKAMDADGTPGQEGKWADEFGYGIAMPSLGHGVHWFDDHEKFPLELPHTEFYVDPEDVTVEERIEASPIGQKVRVAVGHGVGGARGHEGKVVGQKGDKLRVVMLSGPEKGDEFWLDSSEVEPVSSGRTEGMDERAAKPSLSPEGRIAAFRKIVDEKQMANIDGAKIDLFSASAVTQVYDKLSPANQEKFAALSAPKMAAVAWKMMGTGRNEGLVAAYEDVRRESPQLFVNQG